MVAILCVAASGDGWGVARAGRDDDGEGAIPVKYDWDSGLRLPAAEPFSVRYEGDGSVHDGDGVGYGCG